MRNKRAGVLALLVVVAATLLMVFFVLPRVGDDKKDAAPETAAAPAGDAQQPAAAVSPTPAAPEKPAIDLAALKQGLDTLSASAVNAIGTLKTLFSAPASPDAAAIADAKGKAQTALQAIADFKLPEALDAAAGEAFMKARQGAAKALGLLKTLPETPAEALKVLAEMESALTGKPVEAPAEAPAPATPNQAANETPAATGEQNTTGETADAAAPAFDVLRVEPDGSTVIAGRAAPNTKIEILSGDAVVGTVEAGVSGDFAAVLDQPLTAGDYQLVLKATGKDGKSVISQEVATISIPKAKGGELLAMVTTPGKASRILTAPDADAAAETQVAAATPDGAATNMAAPAPAEPTAAPVPEGSAAPAAAETPVAQPAAGQIRVTAVEIEGNRIFIAGVASPRANVAGYADDRPVGKATAAAEGHFVIEGAANLSVGEHTIRVDLLDGSGKVTLRAAVPFTRPEGNQVSAVAQPDGAAAFDGASLDPAFRKLHSDLATALGLLRNLFADGRVPADDALAASRSAAEIALKSLASFQPAPDSNAAFRDIAAKASTSANKALSALQALPRDAKSFGASLDRIAALIEDTLRLVPQDAPSQPATAPAPTASAQADAGAEAAGGEPVTISQAPLTENRESVIIRRGDTLWQISRRVYGMGVRYTTIYLANKDNIDNPDRIRPGQVFGLPKDALPDSEALHRKRLHGDAL